MSRYVLSVPPAFYQAGYSCWAAGAASWLRATQLGTATPEQLIIRFAGNLDPRGALLESDMVAVFKQLKIDLFSNAAKDFTYRFVRHYLTRKGHLLLMYADAGSDLAHAYVIYGVGYPSDDYCTVFDALKGDGPGYLSRAFTTVQRSASRFYVGWSSAAP